MADDRSSNTSFIDTTRSGTLVAGEIRSKERKLAQKEADPDSNQKPTKATEFKDVYDGEWFVDAEEDEELMDTLLQKHGFGMYLLYSVLSRLFWLKCSQTNLRAVVVPFCLLRENKDRFHPLVPCLFQHSLQCLSTVRV